MKAKELEWEKQEDGSLEANGFQFYPFSLNFKICINDFCPEMGIPLWVLKLYNDKDTKDSYTLSSIENAKKIAQRILDSIFQQF